jgi:hypothetical protein
MASMKHFRAQKWWGASVSMKLIIFERKTFRKIFGPTKELNGLCRIKSNEEQDDLI